MVRHVRCGGHNGGAISKLAERLVAKGLVLRNGNGTDKRGQLLLLTLEGLAKVPLLARLAYANDTEYFGVLTVEEREALDWILRYPLNGED